MRLDIKGLDKAVLLMELYRRAKPIGMGTMEARLPYMSVEEARIVLACGPDVEYLYGRVMKVLIEGDGLDARVYDAYNGEGTAARAVFDAKAMTGAMIAIHRQKEVMRSALAEAPTPNPKEAP